MNKELIELNNHINTQFGFDYSYDEEFFKLIGVETKSGESGSESYSYDDYDFVQYDKNGKDGGNEYDEGERNDVVNDAVVNNDKKKDSLPDEGSKRQKGRIIIEEYEDSAEYDENDSDYDFNSKENGVIDVDLVLKGPKDEKLTGQIKANFKNNKDYNYVNDYDETHEINNDGDNPSDDETEEDEEEEYDEDYNYYEGDESEERDENYNDRGQDEENPDESVEENEKKDDYYENNDFSEKEDSDDNQNFDDYGDYGTMEEHE